MNDIWPKDGEQGSLFATNRQTSCQERYAKTVENV